MRATILSYCTSEATTRTGERGWPRLRNYASTLVRITHTLSVTVQCCNFSARIDDPLPIVYISTFVERLSTNTNVIVSAVEQHACVFSSV